MIVIFEGAAGTGKSTLARRLSVILRFPLYRAFRSELDGHAPGSSQGWIKLLRFPVNTWMEDMYMADAFSKVKPNVILDRAMPSAVAYEELGISSAPIRLSSPMCRDAALKAWSERMASANAKLVLLQAPAPLCYTRNGKRFSPEFVQKEQLLVERCARSTGLPLLVVDTSSGTVEANATRIDSWTRGV